MKNRRNCKDRCSKDRIGPCGLGPKTLHNFHYVVYLLQLSSSRTKTALYFGRTKAHPHTRFSKMNLRVIRAARLCAAALTSIFLLLYVLFLLLLLTFSCPCAMLTLYEIWICIFFRNLPETFHYIMEIMWCFLPKPRGTIVRLSAGVMCCTDCRVHAAETQHSVREIAAVL